MLLTLLLIWIRAMIVLVWPHMVRYHPAPSIQRRSSSCKSIEEWKRGQSFPPPTLSSDYKKVAHLILGAEPSHLPAFISHKLPILVNYFLPITLPLVEFFLHQDKSSWASVSPVIRCDVSAGRLWVWVPSEACGFNSVQKQFPGQIFLSLPEPWEVPTCCEFKMLLRAKWSQQWGIFLWCLWGMKEDKSKPQENGVGRPEGGALTQYTQGQ